MFKIKTGRYAAAIHLLPTVAVLKTDFYLSLLLSFGPFYLEITNA